MHPFARAALLIAALSALSRAAESGRPLSTIVQAPAQASSAGAPRQLSSLCPPGTLPDGNVCIPVPRDVQGGADLTAEQSGHRGRSGAWRSYEQIPRRPDRPSDYRRYRLPVQPVPGQNLVVSGYDLDRPDEEQRRGSRFKAIGHGGIDIAQKRGTEVHLVALEHQTADAEVLFVGEVFGNSVVTRHTVKQGGRLREYIVVYGHLQGPAPGLSKGMTLRAGTLVGFVGDSGSPGDVHLHYEVRRVRDGVNVGALAAGDLTNNARTVVCDPRNVLPLVGE